MSDNAIYEEVHEVSKEVFEMDKNALYECCSAVSGTATTSEGKSSSAKDGKKSYKLSIIVLVVVMLILAAACACGAFSLAEVSKMKSETASLQQQLATLNQEVLQLNYSTNFERASFQQQLLATSNQEILQLNYSTMLYLQQLNYSLGNIREIVVENTLLLHSFNESGLSRLFLAPPCAALPRNSPSGYYWVRNSNGSAVRVYCDMTRSCGGVTGGWMRVAELDMTDSSQQCPSGFRQRTDGNIHTCVSNLTSAGCSSVLLPTSNMQYTRVCGRIISYQVGSSDAFFASVESISSAYVDGVSLTHGIPRQHIWTFAAAFDRIGDHHEASTYCPCISNTLTDINIPSFVGHDYFCDSGRQQHTVLRNRPPLFYSADPLWDGAGCGSGNTCCTFNTPPWFYKQLPDPTTDDIEMRVCRDEAGDIEDTAISKVEIFVQ